MGKRKERARKAAKEARMVKEAPSAASTKQVVLKLVFYSGLMWLIPALLYIYSSKDDAQFQGYVAVLLVNVVVVAYIVQALSESVTSPLGINVFEAFPEWCLHLFANEGAGAVGSQERCRVTLYGNGRLFGIK